MSKLSNIQNAIATNYSAWISASAGTGKTKILTDRILNLLLSGIDPHNILCLTFTKAAKGEMISRINSKLLYISQLSNEEIKQYIYSVYGKSISQQESDKIKNYYSLFIENNNEIGIYTIHGFCQYLLQRFPLESSLNPSFNVIDEVESKEILGKLLNVNFISSISKNIKENISLYSLYNYIIETSIFLSSRNISNVDDLIKILKSNYKKLSFNEIDIIEDVTSSEFINFLLKDKEQDYIKLKKLTNIKIEDIYFLFLTKNGEKKKSYITKKLQHENPSISDKYYLIQDAVYKIRENKELKKLIDLNQEILELAFKLKNNYQQYKIDLNLLDYNDLISKAHNLLNNSHYREWVKYKLDGGINHILVDESQDTSQFQWEIIEALIEDFYSTGKEEIDKTIFIVGDVKQSIYSFQDARPDLFHTLKDKVKNSATKSKSNFIDLTLNKTYRLSELTNNFIKEIYKNHKIYNEIKDLEAHKTNEYSRIEIWPLQKSIKQQELFWPTPDDLILNQENDNTPYKIANFIKKLLNEEYYIESEKRSVKEDDFLILVQRRTNYTDKIISALQKENIDIAGIDRVILNENIAVQDILSVLKYIRNKDDKFALISVLKSFFFNLNDQQIFEFINGEYKLESDIQTNLDRILYIFSSTKKSDLILSLVKEFNILQKLEELGLYDSIDAVKTLISKSNSYLASKDTKSLISLINYIEETEISLKRDLSKNKGVKIMTAHGSKGLESPIIILADSNDRSVNIPNTFKILKQKNFEIPLWSFGLKTKLLSDIKEQEARADYDEYLRLMYVALTRVKDYLVICGTESSKKNEEYKSWYEYALQASSDFNNCEIDGVLYKENGKYKTGDNIEYNQGSNIIKLENIKPQINSENNNKRIYNFEDLSPKIGVTYHKIIEFYLNRVDNLDNLIKQESSRFPKTIKNSISQNISNIQKDQKFKNILNTNFYTEKEYTYIDNNDDVKSIRLDLITFKNNKIEIIDFKSDIIQSDIYNDQLKKYYDICSKIYPNYDISCHIYWISHNKWTQIPI